MQGTRLHMQGTRPQMQGTRPQMPTDVELFEMENTGYLSVLRARISDMHSSKKTRFIQPDEM